MCGYTEDGTYLFITGPPNGPVLFCSLTSVVVCNAAGGRAGRVGDQAADTARRASTVTSRSDYCNAMLYGAPAACLFYHLSLLAIIICKLK